MVILVRFLINKTLNKVKMAESAVIKTGAKKNVWGGGMSPMKASYGKLMMWFFLLSDAFTFTGLLIAYGHDRFRNIAYTGIPENFLASPNTWPIPDQVFDAFPFMGHAHLPLVFVGLMTFILIMSSVTMVLAVEAGQRMDKAAVQKWMLWTILGGIAFLGCQAWEWGHFIHGTDTVAQFMSGEFSGLYAQIKGGASFIDGAVVAADPTHFTDLVIQLPEIEKDKLNLITGPEAGALLSTLEPVQGAGLVQNQYGPPAFADFFFFITGFHGTHVLSGVIINIIIFYNASTGLYERRGHYEMIEKIGLYWHFVDLVWVFVFTFFYLV